MFYRRLGSFVAALALAVTVTATAFATGSNSVFPRDQRNTKQKRVQVSEPLNLAILVQDDLISQVANELTLHETSYARCPAGHV